MTQRDIAGKLDINVKTLHKWKKDRPKVYELLMLGLKVQEILDKLKKECEDLENSLDVKNLQKC
ncbi:transcriptional regulator [Campylobacter sp. US33a]|uniref:transcriptional regulator n=1 Tax=Campylobacter sp. US33a TaxID=2498120 RepID=UPI0010679313|nr:transcriptional regulator [Campylobacter sp. US33a]TEY01988.1 transcriptional regulator [Campylobacter sp. US33a]